MEQIEAIKFVEGQINIYVPASDIGAETGINGAYSLDKVKQLLSMHILIEYIPVIVL